MIRKRFVLRALALAVLALMAVQPLFAMAEQEDVQSEAVESPVTEADAMDLAEVLPDEGAEEQPSEADPVPEEEALDEGEELVEEYLALESAPDESGRINRIFDGMVEVDSATWSALNLKRASGYSGMLARVADRLTLSDILIEGNPANDVRLLDYFELAPGASIALGGQSGLELSLGAFSINKGATRSLSVKWEGASLSAKKAKWYTSDKKIATVSSKGKITAKGKGMALITAKYRDRSAVCGVVVTNIVYAKSVKLNLKKLEVALGCEDASLKAKVSPADADVQNLKWASSDPEIAAVDQEGRVTGLNEGTATITAALTNNGKSASCKVTVKETRPESVNFEKLFITLHPGESFETQADFTPKNVTFPGFTYETDDASVCTVDDQGIITAEGTGNATVTVRSAHYPQVFNTCRVSVIREGAARLEGLIIGINPGHQKKTIKQKYPLAPGSSKKAYGVKTGACGKYTRVNEYETTLAIGLKLKRILEEQGAKVVITRTTNDVMLTNIDRANMLNEAGVDIALQLHCNSGPSSKHGNSGYIRTTGDWVEESRAMSATLTAAISEACGCANLGVKIQNNFMSLNWTTTPSVLLEMGYISNRTEDELLATDEYREKMAYGISEGLATYFGR